MKYQTLQELRKAYKSGELDKKNSPLVIDNDSVTVYEDDDGDEEGDSVCVYRSHPATLLEDALNLLGIPWENA